MATTNQRFLSSEFGCGRTGWLPASISSWLGLKEKNQDCGRSWNPFHLQTALVHTLSSEMKMGRNFKRVHKPHEETVKHRESLPPPKSTPEPILHSVFEKGESLTFEIEEDDLEGRTVYPD
ncbi:hypothetical protein SLEP1_g33502 [Rubroshorea leprosula]|uniref:Uncharacterized protein n=1 Tax=Rubroshorea leprosula TaxID=152421 RepID=A0AAV5KGZ1_9ROSI|nr:hypothetical protein SLEP1_g33502 [Rubroshorea leprosula]